MKEHGENWATPPAPCPPRATPHRRGRSRRPRHSAKHALLNDTALAILQAQPSRLHSDYVFPSATGRSPLDARNVLHRLFIPAVRRAKVEDFCWHDIRHTFASRLVMKGVDLRSVQELLGHKTLAMTLRYAHLSPTHLAAAVRVLDEQNEGRSDTKSDTSQVRAPVKAKRRHT